MMREAAHVYHVLYELPAYASEDPKKVIDTVIEFDEHILCARGYARLKEYINESKWHRVHYTDIRILSLSYLGKTGE